MAPAFEGGQMPLHRRLPKARGFSNARFKTTYQVVNLDRLAALYPDGGDVTPDGLAARGAVRPGELVKVLGSGDAVAGLRVSAHGFSAAAIEKITAAGGTATQI
jgi:large subunit ribosomal protein L15